MAVTSSAKNAVKRAEKLAKLAKGEVVGPKKSAEQKKLSKAFYKSLLVDSGYQGQDYDEFSNWLGVAQ